MSTLGTPKVMGPLAGMFSSEAQAAIVAEEAADTLQQEQNAEQATAAASAAAVIAAETSTATATVEAASIDAMLGSVGLPAQQQANFQSMAPSSWRAPVALKVESLVPHSMFLADRSLCMTPMILNSSGHLWVNGI